MQGTRDNDYVLPEHYEQVQFVSWFRRTFDDEIIAIPNGRAINREHGSRLKAEGVRPGVSDLFVPAWYLIWFVVCTWLVP